MLEEGRRNSVGWRWPFMTSGHRTTGGILVPSPCGGGLREPSSPRHKSSTQSTCLRTCIIHALAGVGMICPMMTISWGCGCWESMGRLSPILARTSEWYVLVVVIRGGLF